jgi:hypothetical protein
MVEARCTNCSTQYEQQDGYCGDWAIDALCALSGGQRPYCAYEEED